MRISVAMATYNGEKYFKEQLHSILEQTMQVDEIIISDDGSQDATLECIKEVLSTRKIGGTKVRLLGNNPRHGYCGNFEWLLKHTTGDYIFLSDQDDIWHTEKVEKVIECFYKQPDAMMVFHNAHLIGKNGEMLEGEIIKDFSNNHIN